MSPKTLLLIFTVTNKGHHFCPGSPFHAQVLEAKAQHVGCFLLPPCKAVLISPSFSPHHIQSNTCFQDWSTTENKEGTNRCTVNLEIHGYCKEELNYDLNSKLQLNNKVFNFFNFNFLMSDPSLSTSPKSREKFIWVYTGWLLVYQYTWANTCPCWAARLK